MMKYEAFVNAVSEGTLSPKDGPATLYVWTPDADGDGEDAYLYEGVLKDGVFQSEALDRALNEGSVPPSPYDGWEIEFEF